MKFVLLTLSTIIFVFSAAAFAQTVQQRSVEVKSSIATLYARDPLAQSFCFKDGGYGSAFQEGMVRNRCSDLNFHSYADNGFSVGVEGGREGTIIDLGTPNEVQKRYGYEETVGHGQGFASIRAQNDKIMILKDYKRQTLQEISEANTLFLPPTKGDSSVLVKLGHIYLLRITDRTDKNFELIAKILVISYLPDENVTIRWQVISNETK